MCLWHYCVFVNVPVVFWDINIICLFSSVRCSPARREQKCLSFSMSRYHQRFERDFRSVWERRERYASNSSCGGTVNGCVSTSAASILNSGNNRPGLLPLPVIPSLLPTPVTGATSTANSELTCKRLASTCTTSTTKVGLNTPAAAGPHGLPNWYHFLL